MKKLFLSLGSFFLCLIANSILAQDLTGVWEGYETINGKKYDYELALNKSGDAYFGTSTLKEKGREVLSKRNKQKAENFAFAMKPIIDGLRSEGIKSIRSIAKALNKRKVKTYTGKAKWHVQTVHKLLNRIEKL